MAARSQHHPTVVPGSPATNRKSQAESRQMAYMRGPITSLTPMEHARRSKLLGWSLFVGLLIALTIAVLYFIPRLLSGRYYTTPYELLFFGVVAFCLAFGYICQRKSWFSLGGWVLTLASLVLVSAGEFFFPDHSMLLMVGATIPLALAALLISFQAIYVIALFTSGTIVVILWYKTGQPTFPLPEPLLINSSVLIASLTMLAIILAPLRRNITQVADQMQQAQRTVFQLEDRLSISKQALDDEEAEQQLQGRHVEAVAEHITDGIITTDADGRIVHANRVARQLWEDVFDDELDGRNINVVIARLRSAANDDAIANHLINQIELIAIERDEQQKTLGTSYVLVDRRERMRLTRLRGELLELLAREMHDPLTSMLTALEMILGEKNLPDGTDRVLVGARRSGQRLQNLMETLREVNSLEESRDILRRTPTALRAVIESGIAQTAPQAQQNSVHVVAEYNSDAVLPLDKERLLRAFVNLLYNALRQSPPYSTVHVQTQRSGASIVVRVTDQGPGLSVEAQRTIFARLSSAPDERSGSALGLTFSRLVIEAHGGRIWVESNGGQGSTFAFSLPLEGGKG